MNILVPAAGAALTVNGGTDGYVTVADETPFYPTALAWLSSNRQATLDLSTLAAHHLDTVVKARFGGAGGNAITVAAIGDSAPAGGVTISVVGSAVTIHYESGVSTVGNVETAIGTSTLLRVKTSGTLATVLTSPGDDFTATSLAGGQSLQQRCLITETIATSHKVGLRFIPSEGQAVSAPQYIRNSCSAYTTADLARLEQEEQTVRVAQPTFAIGVL